MSKLIGALAVIVVLYAAVWVWDYWDNVKRANATAGQSYTNQSLSTPGGGNAVLPGLPPSFEASLQAAKNRGADGLAEWLKRYRRSVNDPRLADIELDYVALVARKNPGEAKKIFQAVKARTSANSPVYPRIKRLEEVYE